MDTGPNGERPLGGTPDRELAIGVPHGSCGMGFDITLMNSGATILPFKNVIGSGKSCLNVALLKNLMRRNVARFRPLLPKFIRAKIFVEQR